MQYDFMIIGGGLAGLATAHFLTARGAGNVLLLEKESIPGLHSSGRSAAMIMQVPKDPVLGRLSRRGMQHLSLFEESWHEGIGLTQNGSILMGTNEDMEGYEASVRDAIKAGVAAEFIDGAQCAHLVPVLAPSEIESGIHCPSDGWVNVELLLRGLAQQCRESGRFTMITGIEVEEVVTLDGAVQGVRTNHDRFDAPVIVNAAGLWAAEVGRMAGGLMPPLACYRRHAFVTIPTRSEAESWPIAWNISEGLMFRPHEGGLLMCVCDDAMMAPADYGVNSKVKRQLRETAGRLAPSISPPQIDHAWVGLRSTTPDRRPLVGADPLVRGLFWMAGLGSHGVATCSAAGEIAAELLTGGRPSVAPALEPGRFALQATS